MTVPKPPMVYVGTGGHNRSPGGHPALYICEHIMEGSLSSCDNWFSNPNAQASANYGIGSDGEIHVYVDPTASSPYWAWANGVQNNPDASARAIIAKGTALYGSVSPNVYCVSIEHAGYTGDPIPAAEWNASMQLTAWLCETFNVDPSHGGSTDTILGHYQIDAVNRAACPGFTTAQWSEFIAGVRAWLAPAPPNPGPVEPTIEQARQYAADAARRIDLAQTDLDSASANLRAALESLQF